MGYFPNMTAWETWAVDNCFKCAHWPKGEDGPPCPVESAHMLYGYDLCNSEEDPGKVILDMLIPQKSGGVGCAKCAMFKDRDGLSARHLKDWQKYKAAMAERDAATSSQPAKPEAEDRLKRLLFLKSCEQFGYWLSREEDAELAALWQAREEPDAFGRLPEGWTYKGEAK